MCPTPASHHLPRGLHVQEALVVLETRGHHQLALALFRCATVLMFAGLVISQLSPGLCNSGRKLSLLP